MLSRLSRATTRNFTVGGSSASFSARRISFWAQETESDSQRHDVEEVFNAGMKHHHLCNTAFPIAHSKTIRPYRVPRHRDQKELRNALAAAYGDLDEMMIYAHVPFCHTRCQFCEYTVIDPKVGRVDDVHSAYFDHLLKEFDMYAELLDFKNKTLAGFDIGGGTPSMVENSLITKLYEKVVNGFGKVNMDEVSIETTPKIAAHEGDKMAHYRKLGIKRLSFGLQTTDFSLAKSLGRDDANGDYVQKAVDNARKAGFESLNIDLMYGFPIPVRNGKKVDKWYQTVEDTVALQPDHITLYKMRYKGTKMVHCQDRVELSQVNEQEAIARKLLNENGYVGMIGKNTYSKTPNNSGCSDYLHKRVCHGIPYIGIGLGAQSFSHNSLHYNLGAVTKHMYQYTKSVQLDRIPIQDLYHLSPRVAMGKFVSVSFYYGGIDLGSFQSIFGKTLESVFPDEVHFVLQNNLMVYTSDNRLQMTKHGKCHFPGICALFYTPSIQQHLITLEDSKPLPKNFNRKEEQERGEFKQENDEHDGFVLIPQQQTVSSS